MITKLPFHSRVLGTYSLPSFNVLPAFRKPFVGLTSQPAARQFPKFSADSPVLLTVKHM